jgi:hypothetical protein
LELATDEEMRSCFRNFRLATSNKSLKVEVCVVCAREKAEGERVETHILNDSNIRSLLSPVHHHPAQVLWQGVLVLGERIVGTEDGYLATICMECVLALEKGKLPRFALANDLWIGDVPYQLRTLTIPEQLLIARHYPRCYVFKLYPKEGNQLPPDRLQRGMKGNVSLYELNTNDVVKMLEGQLMPNRTSTLASVLAITFVGSMTLPKDWLKSTFRVRRHCVHEALVWLKQHNCLYGDICIDEERLGDLPEDGIPDEILSLIRHEANADVVEKEEEGYVVVSREEEDELEDVFVNVREGM